MPSGLGSENRGLGRSTQETTGPSNYPLNYCNIAITQVIHAEIPCLRIAWELGSQHANGRRSDHRSQRVWAARSAYTCRLVRNASHTVGSAAQQGERTRRPEQRLPMPA